MINIASIPPASWPTSSTAVAVAPVAAVGAVSPTSRAGREDPSAFGSGSGRRTPVPQDPHADKGAVGRDGSAEPPKAAPILPEKSKAEGLPGAAPSVEDAKKAEQAAQEAEAAQAQRATQREKLLEVLSSVWKASAAVVDYALGRGDQVDAQAVQGSKPAASVRAPVRLPAATPESVPPGLAQADGAAPVAASTEPPVAYTEHGVSQWGALELGQLVSKRA